MPLKDLSAKLRRTLHLFGLAIVAADAFGQAGRARLANYFEHTSMQ